MPSYRSLILFVAGAMLAVGCGSDPQEASDVSAQQDDSVETAFDPMLESLERAKGVEDMAAQRKAELDERIKKETAGDPPD